MQPAPKFPGWPLVLSNGQWLEISPGWLLARLSEGLTPQICEAVALAADQTGLTPDDWYRMALAMHCESEGDDA